MQLKYIHNFQFNKDSLIRFSFAAKTRHGDPGGGGGLYFAYTYVPPECPSF